MKWYGMYYGDAYALGPIEAGSKKEARRIFRRMFGKFPNAVWQA